MSKIEKALKKARVERSLALVPSTTRPVGKSANRDLVTTAESDDRVPDIESRARSSEAIARMREPKMRSNSELAEQRIIFPEMTDNDGAVQAFREVRTRILQRTHGRNAIIMITSVAGQGGSSFVALNLSTAFAFDAGRTAMVMDCNLRNPWLHKLFGDQVPTGLTDYLENPDMDIGEIIHPVGIKRLRAIPAGGKRDIPGEYFTSFRMKRLLDAVRQRYPERFVFLDAPPMTESADTQILAELCDFILLVIPYGKVTSAQVQACVQGIDQKKLLGMVFNNEPSLPAIDWRVLLRRSFVPLQEWLKHLVGRIRHGAYAR